jgi:uncharacterized protein (DUF342 family)
VLARGSIVVGSYIFNAMVRAGGEVTVLAGGGSRGGSIVGGEVIATGGIEARRIGSPDTDRTLVGIGPDPELLARLEKLAETVDTCSQRLGRLVALLGIDTPEPSLVEAAVRRAPPSRRRHLQELGDELTVLVETRQKAIDRRAELNEEVTRSVQAGSVRATEKLFTDVQIRMGDETSAVPEDVSRAVFYRTAEGIRWRPL